MLCYSLADSLAANVSLRAEVKMYENSLKELERLNQMLRDEHQALQLAFASLEDKLRKSQVKTTRIYVIICSLEFISHLVNFLPLCFLMQHMKCNIIIFVRFNYSAVFVFLVIFNILWPLLRIKTFRFLATK